jgi:hypothetical protein
MTDLPKLTSVEERALKLLGAGIPNDQVAAAVGVTKSRISQLLSDESFSARVKELRYSNLLQHAERDNKYDDLENAALDRLKSTMAMVFDPMKIARILQTLNQAKRRGEQVPTDMPNNIPVIPVSLPPILLQQFNTHVNIHNQVIGVNTGADSTDPMQTLVTIQSSQLDTLKDKHRGNHGERNLLAAPPAQTSPR